MKKWSVVIVLALAQFVMVLDSTVMNVSITEVVKDLDSTVNAMQGAIAFYTLTMAAFMLIGAKLCAKWGLLRAFMIGAVVYAIGSFITSISQSMAMLFTGWSVIEGIGAVLVIPAIAALVATNYKGKDRVTAYAIIGGISGAAAAAGPLIGGFMTTYLSWRYVFAAEVVIMAIVIIFARKFKSSKPQPVKLDVPSAFLSAIGMVTIVFAMLQSKTWGWVEPITKPVIAGHEIAPFGISIVAYLLIIGGIILKVFYDRQARLEKTNREPLLKVSMLKIAQLRSGLGVLMAQYLITAAIFFIVPVYLQTVLGLNALDTGMKIIPLSIALILASVVGSKLVSSYSPKKIVRIGQGLLVLGTFFLFIAIDEDLASVSFAISMFMTGAGLGLLASQLGNVNVSSVSEKDSNEIGGLQGTFQNLGSSLGTALIGSIMIAALTSGFLSSVQSSDIPSQAKTTISENVKTVEIIPASQVPQIAMENGADQSTADTLGDIYKESQLASLKQAIFFLFVMSIVLITLSRNIPNQVIKS